MREMIMNNPQKVLIVDDEPSTRFLLKATLKMEGYDISVVSNGQDALLEIEKFPPDVILLDVMMPGMTGFEICQLLKTDKRWKHVPIILLTALAGKKDLTRGFDIGADDFIQKPFDTVELVARVRSMLRIKAQYDQLEQQRQEVENTLHLREELARVTAQRLEELEAIHQIGLNLMNSLDANYILELIAQKALELIPGTAHCLVHFLSDDEQYLVPTVFPQSDESSDSSAETDPWLGNEDIVRQAIDSKKTVYLSDLPAHLPADPGQLNQPNSILVIPLTVDDRAIGTLSIDSPQAEAFEVADRRILSILANQLAVSIMKARLFESLGGQPLVGRETKSRLKTTQIPDLEE